MSARSGRATASFAVAMLVLFGAATFLAPPPAPRPAEVEPRANVVANRGAVDLRLAVARHYLDTAQFINARKEYDSALRQAPRNPTVLAQYGWFLYEIGDTGEARQLITRALAIDPRTADAQWCQANILLYEQREPKGALLVLRGLAARDDLPAGRRAEVTRLIAAAERALTTTPR